MRQLDVCSGIGKRAEAIRRELRKLEDSSGNVKRAEAVRR
jgi:hypothetical protein